MAGTKELLIRITGTKESLERISTELAAKLEDLRDSGETKDTSWEFSVIF
jgi:hypothetical protein